MSSKNAFKLLRAGRSGKRKSRADTLRSFKISSPSSKSEKTAEDKRNQLINSNARTEARLAAVGQEYKNDKDKPNFAERLFGIMDTAKTGVLGVANNVLTDDDVDVFDEMGKSFRGERAIVGSDMLKNMGLEADTATEKFMLGAAGFVLDVGLDPFTYLTFGYGAATKLGSLQKAAKLVSDGADGTRLLKLAEYVPDIKKLIGEGDKLVDIAKLGKPEQFDIWRAIMRETGEELGDKGGIKLALGSKKMLDEATGKMIKRPVQPSLIKGSTFGDVTDALGGKAVRASDPLQAVHKVGADAASLFTPKYKDAFEVGRMGAASKAVMRKAATAGFHDASTMAARVAKQTFGKVDEKLRNFGTIAHQAMDDTGPAVKKHLDDLETWWAKRDAAGKIIDAKDSTPDAVAAARQVLVDYKREEPVIRKALTDLVQGQKFDPARFAEEVRKLTGNEFSDEQIAEAAKAFDTFSTKMRELRLEDIASNVANRKLGDRGLYYVMGMDGTPNKDVVARLREMRGKSFDEAANGAVIDESLDIPMPWAKGTYRETAELVDVADIERFAEFDRAANPLSDIDALAADIKKNGFKEPLIIEVNPNTGYATLTEGNHRLAAAKRAGITEVPVRFLRSNLDETAGHGGAHLAGKAGRVTNPSWIDPVQPSMKRYKNIDEAYAAGDISKAELDANMALPEGRRFGPNDPYDAPHKYDEVKYRVPSDIKPSEVGLTPRAAHIPLGAKRTIAPNTDEAARLNQSIEGLDSLDGFNSRVQTGNMPSDDAYKTKKFDTIQQRLEAGSPAETDAMALMAKRIESSGRYRTKTEFTDGMAHTFGKPIEDGVDVSHLMDKNIIKDSQGVRYIVPDLIVEDWQRLTKALTSPPEVKMFRKYVGKLTSIWKKQATATPGFVMRNGQSNYMLAMAYGMGDVKVWTDGFVLAKQIARGKVDDLLASKYGFENGEALIRSLERNAVIGTGWMQDVIQKPGTVSKVEDALGGGFLSAGVHKANSYIEDSGRIAVYLQSLGRGMDEKVASDMVSRVLYSYDKADLTGFEQNLRDLIPFYTWIRRNLPNQVSILLHDPKYVTAMGKLQDEGDAVTDNSTEWGNMPDYMRQMGAIPIPLANGKKMYLNPNWGWQDITKLETLASGATGDFEPLLKEFIASTSPFFKVPVEFAFNQDSFFGSELVPYEGAMKKAPAYIQPLEKLFTTQPWWETLKKSGGSYTKRDGTLMINPVSVKLLDSIPILANIGRLMEGGDKQPGRVVSIIAGLKLMAGDDEGWANNRLYEDRDNLRDLLDKMRAEETDVPDFKDTYGEADPQEVLRAIRGGR